MIPTFRSRLAPTPSGYLHLGNAFNFVTTWLLTRRQGGSLRLRIDDLDEARFRPTYLEDIFRGLEWLGLDWEEGPQTPDEHLLHHRQGLRLARYQQAIAQLQASSSSLFACTCSRKQIQAHSVDGQYPETCLGRNLPMQTPQSAWRMQTPRDSIMSWEDGWAGLLSIDLYQNIRHPVIKRKDGLPAYQIASVVDDLDQGITHIVRGQDLLPSTALQRYLAQQAGWETFDRLIFYHHPLLQDRQGHKLSKSAGAISLQHWRTRYRHPQVFYAWLSEQFGWEEPAHSAEEALSRVNTHFSFPNSLSFPEAGI